MPRRQRLRTGGVIFHVLNRGVKRATLFETDTDYRLVEDLIAAAVRRFRVRIFCYCIMPNHWHLVLCADSDGELSQFMHWMTGLHAQRWHRLRNSVGTGAVYQGRFKAIPVQCDVHFLRVCRYVERNPARANLVSDAREWRWSSLWRRLRHEDDQLLAPWPVQRPADWIALVNTEPGDETDDIRRFISRSAPFGGERWQRASARALGLEHSMRNRGRPRPALYTPESLDLNTFE